MTTISSSPPSSSKQQIDDSNEEKSNNSTESNSFDENNNRILNSTLSDPDFSVEKILPKLDSLGKMNSKKEKRDFRITMDQNYQTMQSFFSNDSLDDNSILDNILLDEDDESNLKDENNKFEREDESISISINGIDGNNFNSSSSSNKDQNVTLTKETVKEFLLNDQ